MAGPKNKVTVEPIVDIARHIEEEARMILPGIQALFGFQLIAIFNQRFAELSKLDQRVHLIALFCSALSILLALAPAAYHRIAEPDQISNYFCRFGSQCLSICLAPLAVGLCLDLFLITNLTTNSRKFATVASAVLFLLYIVAWFLFPAISKRWKNFP
jgi:hypothetical protein